MSHAATIRAAFDQLRPHIRPEADHLAGTLATAIDQAAAAEVAPPAAQPIGAQLAELVDQVGALRASIDHLSSAPAIVRLAEMAEEVAESRAAIRALTESAGI